MFYHLGELDDALAYALGAGKLFDVNEQSEYVHTLIGKHQVNSVWGFSPCRKMPMHTAVVAALCLASGEPVSHWNSGACHLFGILSAH